MISANPGSGATDGAYKKKLVDGRCKLHMVWTSKGNTTPTNRDDEFPQLKFYSDSDYNDLVFQMTDVIGYDQAGAGVYQYMCCIDLPPQGFLFEDGMWVEMNSGTYELSILVSGGAAS